MYKIKNCLIYNEDSNDVIKNIESNSIDLILTDPPYELGNFRKKIGEWEKSKITESGIFKECLRILKPGGHLVCFSSNRTMYKFGSSIENSGFEIRNTLIWEYKQSIPRNMDIGKAIDCQITYGKTSSKYMKQIEQEYGGASYKIKGTNNTMFGDKTEFERKEYKNITSEGRKWNGWGTNLAPSFEPIIVARKPFSGSLALNILNNENGGLNIERLKEYNCGKFPSNVLNFEKEKRDDYNNHPMVKPTELLKYLIFMFTNEGSTIFDPFMGSGSTGIGVLQSGENRKFIGIELQNDYYNIALRRINEFYSKI